MIEIQTLAKNDHSPNTHRITALRAAVRRQERVNVYVDDRFFCSLDLSQLAEYHLCVGQVVDSDKLEALKKASDFGKLYNLALAYVISRPHSEQEISDYLRRKTLAKTVRRRDPRTGQYATHLKEGYAPSLVPLVMQRLRARGYIDDAQFSRFWIENHHNKRGASLKKLRLELSQKGVNRSCIDAAIAASCRNDRDELAKLIARRRNRYTDQKKLIQYLVRQGFDYSDVVDSLSDTAELSSSDGM
ncbi:RecX family transcriptional regulator [Candidatus Saccharibacteria bacterium]|nr:RecX family transcriptional regulator [Candidatus Saccharibacteria bacterium]